MRIAAFFLTLFGIGSAFAQGTPTVPVVRLPDLQGYSMPAVAIYCPTGLDNGAPTSQGGPATFGGPVGLCNFSGGGATGGGPATQSGAWNVGIVYNGNNVSSSNLFGVTDVALDAALAGAGVTVKGSVSLSGTLPAFAVTPTFNFGTLNGAATDASVQQVKTAIGTPLQAGGSVNLILPPGTWAAPANTVTSATPNTDVVLFNANTISHGCFIQNTSTTSPVTIDFGGGTFSAPVAPFTLGAAQTTGCQSIAPNTIVNMRSASASVVIQAGRS